MASRPWIRSCSGWAFSPPRSSAGEEPGQLADPDGVRAVHGLRPLGAAPAEADFAKQHVEADPGKRDGIDEGEPGQRDPDGAPLHHHPKGDPRHDHGVKQQQQPAEELGKQQLDVVLQTVDHENSFTDE